MLISLNWLKSFVAIDEISNFKKLSVNEKLMTFVQFPTNQLTLTGFELENLFEKKIENKNDIILEIDTTPNRSDITNIIGFSREIKSLMNFPLRNTIVYRNNEIPTNLDFTKNKKKLNNQTLKYATSLILFQMSNVKVKNSPNWLKKRLLTNKIVPKNSIIDLAAYIILEWGQPINIYDLNKIKNLFNIQEKKIKIGMRQAKSGEIFNATNNLSYILDCEEIVLTANNIPIAISGIISQRDLDVNFETNEILIECSNFFCKKITQSSKRLRLRTNTSYLYGKNISHTLSNLAFQHLIKLINLSNSNENQKNIILLEPQKNLINRFIKIEYSKVQKILGKIKNQANSLTKLEILDACQRLNFKVIESDNNNCIVQIPEYRAHLIESDCDVIDEIGRIYGFNNLSSILPETKKLGKITSEKQLMDITKNFLIIEGFNELVQYSFTSKNDNKNIQIRNPLGNEYSTLRTSLLDNLIETQIYNKNQRNSNSSYFEIGRVFSKKYQEEYTMIGGVFGSEDYKNTWNSKLQNLSWYQGKAFLNYLFQNINLEIEWEQLNENIGHEFHPKRSALLHKKFLEIGIFTQIHPLYAKQKNISASLLFFEINLTRLSQLKKRMNEKYENFSLYPKITKDISFEIENNITVDKFRNKIKETFLNLKIEGLELDVQLFDNYQIEQTINKRRLGFKLIFQSRTKTLVNNEIEKITEKILIILTDYVKIKK